jgi:hypothetical protein
MIPDSEIMDNALEGSVRRVGDVVRINTQLIDGASGAHIWAERYDGDLADIFALQDNVTSEIVAQLQITLTPDQQTRGETGGTDNADAHDAWPRHVLGEVVASGPRCALCSRRVDEGEWLVSFEYA